MSERLIAALDGIATPARGFGDLKPLFERIASARIVMLGESSHGTHDFYEWRRMISERLIAKHGFRFIVVEGDWPPCQQIDRYVRHGAGEDSRSVLAGFHRWPTWMWANTEIVRLAERLRESNAKRKPEERAGFHGLDVYSLFESIAQVIAQLEQINPMLARRARVRYGCFNSFHQDERKYARSLLEYPDGCETPVREALKDLLGLRLRSEALFDAQQNARIVANAESYYRAMMLADDDSWNVRDRHMLECLENLLSHYGPGSKAIVWAHNTHIGDYRATSMLQRGEINLGGIAREKFGDEQVALVGFGTYRGSVIAGREWGGAIERMEIPRAPQGTYEEALHRVAVRRQVPGLLLTFDKGSRQGPLAERHGHRAIGVVYQPEYEQFGNYVPTALALRYDAFLHLDATRALEPLHQSFDEREIPETWPVGQ